MRKTKVLRRKRTLGRKRRYSRKRVRTSRKMRGGAIEEITNMNDLLDVSTRNDQKYRVLCDVKDKLSNTRIDNFPDIRDDEQFNKISEYLWNKNAKIICM
jgi:hypothetical protein